MNCYNLEAPLIMHIDLNSCFATIEQQSRPRLRGKPVAVVNRATEHTGIVTASFEAKAFGVRLPMKLRDARQYVLERFDLSQEEILQRLHHHAESVGWRMRKQNRAARGVYVYAKAEGRYWHACQVSPLPFYSNQAIFEGAKRLFAGAPEGIREIGMHCYELVDHDTGQLSIFADELARERAIVTASDAINERYGERTIVAADTIDTGIYVSQKIPFGSTRYFS